MNILLLHAAVSLHAQADDLDAAVQLAAVADAVTDLGYSYSTAVLLDNEENICRICREGNIDAVFNLVEPEAGKGHSIAHAPRLLENLHVPFTGAGSTAMTLSSNKLFAKRVLHEAGIPTPDWIENTSSACTTSFSSGCYIVKPVWEHASLGLDESALCHATGYEEVQNRIALRAGETGSEWFAERYIEGREFSVSVIGACDSPEVLSPAEMIFTGDWGSQPKILDYAAKWNEDSFTFSHTRRTFEIADELLPSKLSKMALACWNAFKLSGYARVDFRVDSSGLPFVIDVNANPCLSPDAGLAAAAQYYGIVYSDLVSRIIDAAA
ncbi:ATP-grasp domain-containing protein [Halodesulfovibrio aestuarii]|uniref:D-alanine--D-alanine ligase family protein n=1 Tax=Halodesulfovibrio aestuarii TaxID=126333 RepID=UPI0003FE5FDA